jgi:hypothetical protein
MALTLSLYETLCLPSPTKNPNGIHDGILKLLSECINDHYSMFKCWDSHVTGK